MDELDEGKLVDDRYDVTFRIDEVEVLGPCERRLGLDHVSPL